MRQYTLREYIDSYWNDERSFPDNSHVGNGCYMIFKVVMVRKYHHSP